MTDTTTAPLVACANRVHKDRAENFGYTWRSQQHHNTIAEVKECFATEGGIWSVQEQNDMDYQADMSGEPTEEEEWVARAKAAEARTQDHIDRYGW